MMNLSELWHYLTGHPEQEAAVARNKAAHERARASCNFAALNKIERLMREKKEGNGHDHSPSR